MEEANNENILESLFDGVYFVDTNKRITYWNKAAEKLTGYNRRDVLGFSCSRNLLRHIDGSGHELCKDGCPLTATLLDGKAREANVYLHHKRGHRIPVSIRVTPVKDSAGNILGCVETFTENSNHQEVLEDIGPQGEKAYLDELTQVGNRRYGEMVLQTRLYEMKAFGITFGLLRVDIDRFEDLNEAYGHGFGDDALLMVANTLNSLLRRLDSVCRWDEDEFLVILANANQELLAAAAERIRIFIDRSFIMVGKKKLSVTATLGGTLAIPGESIESLIARSGRLVNAGKLAGRNRVNLG